MSLEMTPTSCSPVAVATTIGPPLMPSATGVTLRELFRFWIGGALDLLGLLGTAATPTYNAESGAEVIPADPGTGFSGAAALEYVAPYKYLTTYTYRRRKLLRIRLNRPLNRVQGP